MTIPLDQFTPAPCLTPRQRLERLLTIMRDLAATEPTRRPLNFDLQSWAQFKADEEGTICSTSACACGWGALDPVLRREGLTLMANGEILESAQDLYSYGKKAREEQLSERTERNAGVDPSDYAYVDAEETLISFSIYICQTPHNSMGSLDGFFGITDWQSHHLFFTFSYPISNPTAGMVADRIQMVLDAPDTAFVGAEPEIDDDEAAGGSEGAE